MHSRYKYVAMLPVKTDMSHDLPHMCPGARRSFFCRMRCHLGPNEPAEMMSGYYQQNNPSNDKKYVVVEFLGYLKSRTDIDDPELNADGGSRNMTCFLAIAKKPVPFNQITKWGTNALPHPVQFMSRHATDGKFLSIDNR